MANFNKIILCGNLTRDPQLKYLPNQTAIVEFGLAVNRKFKVNGEDREEVLFVDDKLSVINKIPVEQCPNLKTVLFSEYGLETLKAEIEDSLKNEAARELHPKPITPEIKMR